MPVLLVGHGSPTNAIEENSYTRKLHELSKSIPRQKRSALFPRTGFPAAATSSPWTARGRSMIFTAFPSRYTRSNIPRRAPRSKPSALLLNII